VSVAWKGLRQAEESVGLRVAAPALRQRSRISQASQTEVARCPLKMRAQNGGHSKSLGFTYCGLRTS